MLLGALPALSSFNFAQEMTEQSSSRARPMWKRRCSHLRWSQRDQSWAENSRSFADYGRPFRDWLNCPKPDR